jgi:hypothetical protein
MPVIGIYCCFVCVICKKLQQGRQLLIQMFSSINCCGRKAVNITYSGYVTLALVTQHAVGLRHIAICDLPLYNIFPQYQK